MHEAQFVHDPDKTRDVGWAQVSKVRNVLWNRFVFGLGREEADDDGRLRTVFVDASERGESPAVLEISEDPAAEVRTLRIRTADADSFADMLGAVSRNVDAVPVSELARQVRAAPEDPTCIDRLSLALVGVRYDRDAYDALANAILSTRPGVRRRAAMVAKQLGWRPLVRPLWGALARQVPGTEAHVEMARAFSALDRELTNVRCVLSREMELSDVVTLSQISFDLAARGLVASASGAAWTVCGQDRELAWRVFESEGVLVFEVAPAWRERTLGLVSLLNVESRVELLEAASERKAGALVRLAQLGREYDPLVDELFSEGLGSASPALRLDALVAIATAEWDPAVPDLEDLIAKETNAEVRQLARALLIQHRGS